MNFNLLVALLLVSPIVTAEPAKPRSISAIVAEAKDASGRQRSKALDELAERTPELAEEVSAIADALRSKDPDVQSASLKALHRVPKTAKHLKVQAERMLGDSSERVQLGGIIIAGRTGMREIAPRIREKLSQRPRYKIREKDFGGVKPDVLEFAETAATTLVDLNDFESIDEILSRDEIMALGSFGGPLVARFGARALPKGVALARQKDTLRRNGGRGVISMMRDPAAVPMLIELGKDADGEIASAAILALSQIPATNPRDKSQIEGALLERVQSKDRFVRGPAYDGLLRLDPNKHLPAALEAIKTDRDVRLEIFYAIGKNRITGAVPALEAFIREDEVRQPNWTNERAVAAQVIYKLTGRKVPYLGVEREQRIYRDPYDPSKR